MDSSTPARGQMSAEPQTILMFRDEADQQSNMLLEAIRNDDLRQYERKLISNAEWCILTAAKLIAPFIDSHTVMQQINGMDISGLLPEETASVVQGGHYSAVGYDWCLEQIRRHAAAARYGFPFL